MLAHNITMVYTKKDTFLGESCHRMGPINSPDIRGRDPWDDWLYWQVQLEIVFSVCYRCVGQMPHRNIDTSSDCGSECFNCLWPNSGSIWGIPCPWQICEAADSSGPLDEEKRSKPQLWQGQGAYTGTRVLMAVGHSYFCGVPVWNV